MGGKPVRPRLNEHKNEIIYDYKKGDSILDLAIKHTCSSTAIRDFLLDNKVPLKVFCRPKKLEKHADEIDKLYQTGVSVRELAYKYGVDRNTITYYLRCKNIKRKTGIHKRQFYIESKVDIGMLAGLLLGEGSIMIDGRRAFITITNQDATILGWLNKFGGNIHFTKPRKGNINPCGRWGLARAVDVFHCLSILLPHLLGKKKQLARAALHFLRHKYGFKEVPEPSNHQEFADSSLSAS